MTGRSVYWSARTSIPSEPISLAEFAAAIHNLHQGLVVWRDSSARAWAPIHASLRAAGVTLDEAIDQVIGRDGDG